MKLWDQLGNTIGVILVIFTLSLPFKDTPLFRFAEHSMVAVTVGYTTTMYLKSIYNLGLLKIAAGDIVGVVGFLIGLTMLFRLSRQYSRLSNYAVAIMVGVTVGVAMRGAIDAQIVKQVGATAKNLFVAETTYDGLMAIIQIIAISSVLIYFTFTGERKALGRGVNKLGRYFIVIGFGGMYANAIMTRIGYISNSLRYIFTYLGIL